MVVNNVSIYLPRPKVANILNVSNKTVYRLEKRGILHSVRVSGNKTLVSMADVKSYIASLSK